MADTLRDLAYGAALRGQLPQQPPPMRDTLASLLANSQGTIGAPYRQPAARMAGEGGSMLQRLAEALSNVSAPIPYTDNQVSLKDMTLGDSGQVIEDWSYGRPPLTGGNYATGGIGTIGLQPRAMELLNLGGVAAVGQKGANMLRSTLR